MTGDVKCHVDVPYQNNEFRCEKSVHKLIASQHRAMEIERANLSAIASTNNQRRFFNLYSFNRSIVSSLLIAILNSGLKLRMAGAIK